MILQHYRESTFFEIPKAVHEFRTWYSCFCSPIDLTLHALYHTYFITYSLKAHTSFKSINPETSYKSSVRNSTSSIFGLQVKSYTKQTYRCNCKLSNHIKTHFSICNVNELTTGLDVEGTVTSLLPILSSHTAQACLQIPTYFLTRIAVDPQFNEAFVKLHVSRPPILLEKAERCL